MKFNSLRYEKNNYNFVFRVVRYHTSLVSIFVSLDSMGFIPAYQYRNVSIIPVKALNSQ
jgi:hypothetical protein